MIDDKTYKEVQNSFSGYLAEKKLRKTEERTTILEQICSFSGYFDISMLHDKLAQTRFHVSKATLYNTLDVLIESGIVIKHQLNSNSLHYELRILAETHVNLVCLKCGSIRQIKNSQFKNSAANIKTSKFTPELFLLYIYGICSKCKYNRRGSKSKKTKA